jgi:hypothetical protein
MEMKRRPQRKWHLYNKVIGDFSYQTRYQQIAHKKKKGKGK